MPQTGQPGLVGTFYGLQKAYGSNAENIYAASTYCPFGYKGQVGYISDMSDNGGGGLINCQHRWYDPYSARWISRDPTGLDGGENLYQFCAGNPITLADPSGLDAKCGDDGDGWFSWARYVTDVKQMFRAEASGFVNSAVGLVMTPVEFGKGYTHGGWSDPLYTIKFAGHGLVDGAMQLWKEGAGAWNGDVQCAGDLTGQGIFAIVAAEAGGAFKAELPECFVAGTLVKLADGSARPIEELRPGDKVLAKPEF